MDPSQNFYNYRAALKAAKWRSTGNWGFQGKIIIPFFRYELRSKSGRYLQLNLIRAILCNKRVRDVLIIYINILFIDNNIAFFLQRIGQGYLLHEPRMLKRCSGEWTPQLQQVLANGQACVRVHGMAADRMLL